MTNMIKEQHIHNPQPPTDWVKIAWIVSLCGAVIAAMLMTGSVNWLWWLVPIALILGD